MLDTSAYSAFKRGDQRLRKWFAASKQITVPLIVIGELRFGFVGGNQQIENERLLQQFLDSPNVITATITNKTTQLYASIFVKLRQAGKPIGTNDIWIAATALEQGTQLLTLDADFKNIADLKLAKV